MRQKLIGSLLVIQGIVFNQIETKYFGNNLFPQSWQEALCDGICLVLVFLGLNEILTSNKNS
jgi:TRAP-type C4-dicarboxylate transport system permease small subunit